MASLPVKLTDRELLMRLRATEDPFVERKTMNDLKDVLKTIVAFANSTPIGYPAVLYIGATDAGSIEVGRNLDKAQKEVNKALGKVYPSVMVVQKLVVDEAGRECLAVVVPGSENRPHFSGPAYVRSGSESLPASEQQFTDTHSRAQ